MKELEFFSTRVTKEIKRGVKIQAAMQGLTTQQMVEKIFSEYLKIQNEKEFIK